MNNVKNQELTFKINLKEVRKNVVISMKQCMIQNTKKNMILLTFLFMSAQLYNQFAIKNNLEPISLKQLNELDIHKGGGKKKKQTKGKKKKKQTKGKKKKQTKGKKKKRRRKSLQHKKTKKSNFKQISIIRGMISKFKIAGTLLMIMLTSMRTAEAQVASVGIPFDDFVEEIHNTVGIGKDPLTYKEQHELTYNWQLNTNNPSHTYVTGYCAVQSAVSAGLLNDHEYSSLLMNIADVSKLTEEIKEIKDISNTNNNTNTKFKHLKYYLNLGLEDSRIHPKFTNKNNKKLKIDTLHPGSAVGMGFPYAAVLSVSIATTIFGIPEDIFGTTNISNQTNIDVSTQEMFDIVHLKLVEDRNYALQKQLIKENDVISGVIVYPGHAMAVTVLPSGSLVVRNADYLHLPNPIDWLTYKPPLDVDLNDKLSPGIEQVMYEWKKLNKNINPITRSANQFIGDYNINLTPYGGTNTSILSYLSKPLNWLEETTILQANEGNMPKDSLSPLLFNSLKTVKYREITLIGSITSPNFNPKKPLAKKTYNHNRYFQQYYKDAPEIYLDKINYFKCKGLSGQKFLKCFNKKDEGTIISKNMGLFELGESGGKENLMITGQQHIPKTQLKLNKGNKKLIGKLKAQHKEVKKIKNSRKYNK